MTSQTDLLSRSSAWVAGPLSKMGLTMTKLLFLVLCAFVFFALSFGIDRGIWNASFGADLGADNEISETAQLPGWADWIMVQSVTTPTATWTPTATSVLEPTATGTATLTSTPAPTPTSTTTPTACMIYVPLILKNQAEASIMEPGIYPLLIKNVSAMRSIGAASGGSGQRREVKGLSSLFDLFVRIWRHLIDSGTQWLHGESKTQ